MSNRTVFEPGEFDPEEQIESPFIFKNASDFSYYIQMTAVNSEKTCTQVVLEYCDQYDLDPSDIAKFINRSLKEQVALEMQEDGLMLKGKELDFL